MLPVNAMEHKDVYCLEMAFPLTVRLILVYSAVFIITLDIIIIIIIIINTLFKVGCFLFLALC